MSAFVVSKGHIDYIATAGISYGRAEWMQFDGTPMQEMSATDLGRALWTENVTSVRARYEDADESGMIPDIASYRYAVPCQRVEPVMVLKAIDCYEYQSCEHENWQTSAAKELCERLRGAAISRLPGYAEAPWGID